jgi:hypothetical protein
MVRPPRLERGTPGLEEQWRMSWPEPSPYEETDHDTDRCYQTG